MPYHERYRKGPPALSREEDAQRRLAWIERVTSLTNGHDGSDQQPVSARLNLEEFYLRGLSHAYNVRAVKGYIVIATESRREKPRKLLKASFGSNGEIVDVPSEVRVKLPPAYAYLRNPRVEEEQLRNGDILAVHSFGVYTGLAEPGQMQLTLPDYEYLERLRRGFKEVYGYSIGYLTKGKREQGILEFRSLPRALGSLAQNPNVQALPAFPFTKELFGL